jgi:hypothetical protein
LKPEAVAHFTTAVHFNPYRETTWKHLGYTMRDGRWMSREEAAGADRDEREQRAADRKWEPLLTKCKHDLASKLRRADAETRLAAVTDPRAVPSIVRVFAGDGRETSEGRAVELLGRIDDPGSSLALAELAARTGSTSVRQEAIAILRNRPPRDYAGALVKLIRPKIVCNVVPVQGPGSRGALILETPRVRMIRTYDAPAAFAFMSSFFGYAGYDANGLPVVIKGRELPLVQNNPIKLREIEERTAGMIAEANVKAEFVRQQMAADMYQVVMLNEQSEKSNARITPVLQAAAGAPSDLKGDEKAWNVWWYDTLGYRFESPPQVTFVQDVTPAQLPPPYIGTCFAAGTPVATLEGPRPIEAIQIGDQVLSQDAESGLLSFQSVVFLHHNPPDKTVRLTLRNGDSMVCSVYHRFWRAGIGWTMARDLKPGNTLRTLAGLVRVASVEPDVSQLLYNLDVAGSRTFFAGSTGALVHDNTLPDPRQKAFDAVQITDAKGE